MRRKGEEVARVYRAEVSRLRDLNRHIAAAAVLDYIWEEAVELAPQTIVELGTGVRGIRTKVLCYVSALFDADQVSVDVKDCRECGNDWNPKWRFIHADARPFAQEWPDWAMRNEVNREIDLLFIDTDEKYETTREIWQRWSPYLSPLCTVMFRCSNLRPRLIYQDGSVTQKGWDNQRGVAKAIEDIIGPMNEMAEWRDQRGGWDVSHYPWGAGLTILRRGGR